MGERILKIILPLIPMVLLVASVTAAFATHDWNVQATLFKDDPAKKLEKILSSGAVTEDEILKIEHIDLSDDRITLDIKFHSPLGVPVTIKELSADITAGGAISTLGLRDYVEVPARGSAGLKIEGPLNETPSMDQVPQLSNLTVKLAIGGIEMEVRDAL